MFFIFSKTISTLLMPIFWLLTILIFALWTKNENKRKKAIKIFLLLLIILTNPFIINSLLLMWEIPPTPLKDVKKHDIGIVLTGITRFKTPNDRTYFDTGADRIYHALVLYQQKKISKILITGGNIDIFGEIKKSEAERLKDFLTDAGVPKNDIILEINARNTKENAKNTKEIIEKNYPKSTSILITSAFHLRRAKGCFQKAGVSVTPFSAGFYTQDLSEMGTGSLIPSEKSLYLWYVLTHEILGYFVYWGIGYL
ncbi:MAG: YdcF family protein [Cytophagales bacterium]|nr:MAG: YdcF family protein [Cytophagales bacterium]TAH28637.1 MAG: YdcF family protein [Cytophagales bacterium]